MNLTVKDVLDKTPPDGLLNVRVHIECVHFEIGSIVRFKAASGCLLAYEHRLGAASFGRHVP